MKKRILSIILSIVMLVGLLPTTALAGATTAEPVKTWNIGAPESGYTATDAVVAKLYTHATDNTKYDLVISGTGDMASTSGTSMPWTKYDSPYQEHIVSVTVESGVTNVESYAFMDCTALTSVTLGDTVTEIGEFAFDGCTALTSVTLGDTVTEIRSYAFGGCTSLTGVTIPASTTSIASSAFGGCTSLTAYTVDSENEVYSAADGILFSKDEKTLVSYPSNKSGTSYTVPDSVTKISSSAFCYVTNLTELTIPHTTTTIVGTIFYGKAFEGKITIKGHTGSAAEDYTEWDSDSTTFVSICSDGDDADTLCDVCGYDTAHAAHPVCGDAECASHGSGVAYTAWDGTGTPSGNVYLTNDVNNAITISSGEVNLCLNGHSITSNASGESSTITVSEGAVLNICDCQTTAGTIEATGDRGNGINNSGTITVYGGTIGGKLHSIDNKDSGVVNISGGSVNKVIYNSGDNGIVNVSGGSVEDGTYGIQNGKGTVNISGGTVSGDAAGIRNHNYGHVTVSAGYVSSASGSGISNFNSGSTVTVSGGSVSGKESGIDNSSNATATVTDGTVTGVECGIKNRSSGTLTVSGGSITATGSEAYGIDNRISGLFNLSGVPTITGTAADISLYSETVITIVGELTYAPANAISVKLWTWDDDYDEVSTTGTFTSDWNNYMASADFSNYFTSADSGYTVQPDGNGELKLAVPITYTVTYNGNGATSGDVPADSNSPYISSGTVTVLGNTGNLAKTGYAFVGWNTWSSGYGTDYAPGATFNINSNTTLYAQWEEYEITSQPVENDPSVGTNADSDIASYQWYKGTMSDVTTENASAYTSNEKTSSYSDGWWTCHDGSGYSGSPGYFTITLNAGDSILAQTSDVINDAQLGIVGSAQDWDWTTPDDHFLVTAPEGGNYKFFASQIDPQPTVKAQVFYIGSTPADGATSKTLEADEDGWYACKITYKDGTVLYSGPVEYEAPSIPVSGVTLSESSLTLDVGDTAELTATISPNNATDKTVSWTSSDPTVAKVENGLVTALKPGSTTITTTANDGSGKSATCSVTVNKIAITGPIAITTTKEPTVGQEFSLDYIVIPDGNYRRMGRGFSPQLSIEAGKDYTLSVELKPNDGYYFANGVAATVNGKAATVVRSGDNISIKYTYSFASPAANSVDILQYEIPVTTVPIVLPGIEQADVVLPFTAKVLDQYGHEMTGQTIEWSITGTNTTGISANNGTVTVTKDAAVGNYTLTATYDGKSDSITIKVEKAESVLTTVKIFDGGGSGKEITTVDRTIPDVGSKSYINSVAKGYDQYGELMTGLSFAWSNTNTDSEISLVNGYVTIGPGAQEGSFSYTASCNGKSATVTVNLTKKIYTVTYTDNVANETVFSDLQLPVQSGGKAPVYLDGTPSRTGYIFGGWYNSTDGGATLSDAAYDFDTPVTGNLTLYAKWTEKNAVSITETAQTYTWDGNPKSFAITGTPNTGFAVQYKVNGNWTTTAPSAVGTYDVKITRAEDDTYKAYEKIITGGLVINAAAPEATAPTAKTGLVYDGNAKSLINAGTSEHGYWEYSLDGTSYSSDIPTGTDAKTYTVYCRFVPNTGYANIDPVELSVTIDPMAVDEPTVVGTYTYTGSEQTVVLDGFNSSYMIITGGNKGTNAGNYVVTVTLDDNHKWNASSDGEIEWSIASADMSADITASGYNAVFDNQAHTISVAIPDGASIKYGITEGTYNLDVAPEYTNAGIYTVYYKVEKSNYNDVTGSADVVINEKDITNAEITLGEALTFNGNEQTQTIASATVDGLAITYNVSGNVNTNAGNYTLTITGNGNFEGTAQKTYAIARKSVEGANVGSFNAMTYTGSTQTPVASVTIDGLTATGTWSKVTKVADTTTFIADGNFTGTIANRNAGMSKATPAVTAPVAADGLVYNGTAQKLATAGSTTAGILKYSIDNANWIDTIPEETNAANYTVYYKVIGDENYNDVVAQSISVSIAKADSTATPPTANTLTYNTSAQTLVTAGIANGGQMQYSLDGTTWSADIPAGTNANTYTVYYKVVGDANHDDNAGGSVSVTIGKADKTAPEVAGVDETIKSKADGRITGVDDTMEYKKQGDANYIAITADTVENLAAGTYLVRYKETENYFASSDKQIVIADGVMLTIAFNSNEGTSVDSVTCEWNQTITAPTEPTKDGFEFISWYLDDTLTTKWTNEYQFTADTTLYAKWVQGTVSDHEDHVDEIEADGLNDVAKAEETDIKLVVQVEEATEGDSEQIAIKGIADAPNNFGFYDITLEKSSGGYVTNASSVIEIKLPYDFTRKTNIKVYRYHSGVSEELAQLDARATAPYVDGKCYVDKSNNCIYIYSSKFSTYAVAYDTVRSSSGGGTTRYTVKFDTNGGSSVSSATVTKNAKVAEPKTPEKDGYTFGGWYTDKEFAEKYDFESKVTKNFTLYAKWDKHDDEQSSTDTHNCPSLAFDDLDITKWYHFDTDYVIENGIFKGTTETTFEPDSAQTRAMMVTVLYRAEGEPAVNRSIPFADVDMGAYYANAVIWGQQNGIIKGYSETEFGPDDKITREQIAAIMHRYAQYKGIDVSIGENTNILSYDDFDSISEYAIPSMQWAVGSGLIKGKSESTLNPLDNATRAEIAAILHRFIEANK